MLGRTCCNRDAAGRVGQESVGEAARGGRAPGNMLTDRESNPGGKVRQYFKTGVFFVLNILLPLDVFDFVSTKLTNQSHEKVDIKLALHHQSQFPSVTAKAIAFVPKRDSESVRGQTLALAKRVHKIT